MTDFSAVTCSLILVEASYGPINGIFVKKSECSERGLTKFAVRSPCANMKKNIYEFR